MQTFFFKISFLHFPAGCPHCLQEEERISQSRSCPTWWEKRCCKPACGSQIWMSPSEALRWSLSTVFSTCSHVSYAVNDECKYYLFSYLLFLFMCICAIKINIDTQRYIFFNLLLYFYLYLRNKILKCSILSHFF